MYKDYIEWMKIKKEINNSNLRPLWYRERDIWMCNLGENMGFEEDGKGKKFVRPVLVLKKFNRNFCIAISLSSINREGKYYYSFNGKSGKISTALLSQIRCIDSLRLRHKMGKVSQKTFIQIKQKIKETLNL